MWYKNHHIENVLMSLDCDACILNVFCNFFTLLDEWRWTNHILAGFKNQQIFIKTHNSRIKILMIMLLIKAYKTDFHLLALLTNIQTYCAVLLYKYNVSSYFCSILQLMIYWPYFVLKSFHREFYTTERSKYMEHMKHLDEDLRLTRATLSKELQWREKMDDSYKQILREKRDLITQ